MPRKMTPKIKKSDNLHVLTWAITIAILWGAYLFFGVIFEMVKMEIPFFSKKVFSILMTIYPGLRPTFLGIFIGLFYGIIHGAISGGLFAYLHNEVRKRLK
ncbi:hypothetical protein GF385_02790 [Candidatus Dependentiae bacterium]|nr:hypothetical protein [Candidatus Dependentiae bacterium]